MTVPDFQSLMLPVLTVAEDGQEHRIRDAIVAVAARVGVTEEDRRELLNSGREAKFDNRVRWAAFYLRKAGLLESTNRGRFRITERGVEVLEQEPSEISIKFLERFAEFVQFRTPKETPDGEEGDGEAELTPQEILESSYQDLRHGLAQDLLERVRSCSPAFFERLVVDLLVAMGYGGSRADAAQAVGGTGDEGIDGIIKEDWLGLDVVYIQAKRWQATVGRPQVQTFAGSLEGQRARKGVFITTSQFSQGAKEYVDRIQRRIVLIDGEELAQLMIDHGIGVSELETYAVKGIDLDYFDGEW